MTPPPRHLLPSAGTCILFGDGCGAVVVTANPDPEAQGAILGMEMGSDGAGHKHLHCSFAGEEFAGGAPGGGKREAERGGGGRKPRAGREEAQGREGGSSGPGGW
jgi:3-oxoacyl-[acyl-carrier-protein] synthase III